MCGSKFSFMSNDFVEADIKVRFSLTGGIKRATFGKKWRFINFMRRGASIFRTNGIEAYFIYFYICRKMSRSFGCLYDLNVSFGI